MEYAGLGAPLLSRGSHENLDMNLCDSIATINKCSVMSRGAVSFLLQEMLDFLCFLQ